MPRLDLEPHASKDVTLDLPKITPAPGVEYWLTVTFHLVRDTRWGRAGDEMAWEQMSLAKGPAPVPTDPSTLPPLTLAETATAVRVEGTDVAVGIDKTTGLIQSLRFKGKELLARPLGPHFWRAPTDNDRGNDMPRVSGLWRDAHRFLTVGHVGAEQLAQGLVRVSVEATLPAAGAGYRLVYTVRGTGDIDVEASFDSTADSPPELPRFGLQAWLVPGFEQLTWYGPGPEETYVDRRRLRVGVHRASVDARSFAYSQPQETGNQVDMQVACAHERHRRRPARRRPAAAQRERLALRDRRPRVGQSLVRGPASPGGRAQPRPRAAWPRR